MNIDDLQNDINEMQLEWDSLSPREKEELMSMDTIAQLYEEGDRDTCEIHIMKHRESFGIKLNIM